MPGDNFNEWPATDKAYLTTILATAMFNTLIQGTLIVATHRYFSLISASRDGVAMRVFVGVVMTFVLIHTIIGATKVYYVAIARIYWLCPFEITINGLTCLLSQSFFAYRCWRVTHRAISVVIVLAVCLSGVVAGTFGVIVVPWISYVTLKAYISPMQYLIYIWGISSLLFEVCVVFLLFRFLWSSRTGIRGLDRVILRLFAVSLESSLPCLIFLALTIITVLLRDVASNFFAFSTASLYGLSLMVALNSRDKIQTRLAEYRNQGGLLNFSENQTNGMTESQVFSDEALALRRASAANGIDPSQQYKRPSIVSFVKGAVLTSPAPARVAV
ncbi:hypothetical protein FS842_004382 [Serendipita sp. 407]|nr:hypothetical protein FS842_004382 [Serendipita sp. 407]